MDNRMRKTSALVVTAIAMAAGSITLLAGTPPNPEKRKPEVVANWNQLDDKVKADIEKVEPYLYRKLNIYWTDKAPAIDGKLDDRCWAEAEVADGFIKETSLESGLKVSANRTEVRVCYDSANLYVAYRLYDDAIDKLALGQPQDYRDIIEPHGNAVELFLDPMPGDDRTKRNQDDNRYLQLAVNPRGTTYDSRGYGGLEWNPDCEIKTSIQKDCWIVEARLPFRCLNFPPEPTATPQTGDVWGVEFCRDQAVPQEWSRWTSSGMNPVAGFHFMRNFGRMAFKGRKQDKALPAVGTDRGARLGFGRNELSFSIRGDVDRGMFTLLRNGDVVTKEKLKPGPEVRIPFNVMEGGELRVEVAFARKGVEVYRYDVEARLPMAMATLDEIRRDTDALAKRMAALTSLPETNLLARCRAFAVEAARLKAVFDSGKVDSATLAAFTKLHGDWRSFDFDAGRVNLYPADAAAKPFAAFAVDAYTKIFPRRIPAASERLPEARLEAAGNDRESIQIPIVPFWGDLESVKIAVLPLTNATHAIAAANVECFRMAYAQHEINYRKILPGYDPGDPESHRDWPDVLLPVTNGVVRAPADRITTLWLDVLCPAGTPEGTYRGAVVLSAKGHTVTVPMTLVAPGFDIPRHSTLRHSAWLGYQWLRLFHGAEYAKKMDNFGEFLKLYENDLRMLEKYRMAQYPFGNECWNWIKTSLEPDGRYSFDFTDLANVIRLGRRYGANWFTASFGCNPGGVWQIACGSLPVTERATGKTLALKDCPNMKALFAGNGGVLWKPGDSYSLTYASPVYRDFLPQFVAFLKYTGMLEYSYFEQYDENKPAQYLPGHRTLRQIEPDLPLMNEGPIPQDESLGMHAVGYVDRWEPGLNHFDDADVVRVLRERRLKYGETYGFYVCAAMERADERCVPYIKISQPTVAPRILSWFAWKNDVDHLLIFMIFAGFPEKGWSPEQPPVSVFPGYSPLTYPGPAPDYTLIPSIRLASLRDGLEDYEYFKILHGLTAYLDDQFPPHKDLLSRANAELAIEPGICKNSLEWTGDAGKLRAKRAKLVNLIREIKAAIAAYPESRQKEER